MVTYLCCSYSCRRELLLGLWHHSLSLFLVRLGCPTPLSHSTSNHCVALCTHPVFRDYLACVFKLFLFLWTICTTGARIMFILIFMVYPPWGKKSINIYWLINHQSPLFRSYFRILIGLKKKKKELKTNIVLMPTPPWDLGDGHVPAIPMVILNAVYKIKVFFPKYHFTILYQVFIHLCYFIEKLLLFHQTFIANLKKSVSLGCLPNFSLSIWNHRILNSLS